MKIEECCLAPASSPDFTKIVGSVFRANYPTQGPELYMVICYGGNESVSGLYFLNLRTGRMMLAANERASFHNATPLPNATVVCEK